MEAITARRRFTVEEFQRMGAAGILVEDDRVELLDGQILEMAAIGSRHAACVARLDRLVHRLLGDDVIVWVQNPVIFDGHTQLVPDLALLRPREDFYADAHPRPRDVRLLIEVSDATLTYDRGVKIPVYGRTGVPETWLVNLRDRRVEVYGPPAGEAGYGEPELVPEDGRAESATLPGLSMQVDEVLG